MSEICACRPPSRILPSGNGPVQPQVQNTEMENNKIIFGRNIHLVQYIVHLVQIDQSTAKPYTESGFLWCEKVRVVRYKLAILRYKLIASLYFGIASLYLRILSLYRRIANLFNKKSNDLVLFFIRWRLVFKTSLLNTVKLLLRTR